MGGQLADDHLAWPSRVGPPAGGDDDTVLVEIKAVQRPDQLYLLVEGRVRICVPRGQGAQAAEGHVRLGRPDLRQGREPPSDSVVPRAGIKGDVGWVARGQDP